MNTSLVAIIVIAGVIAAALVGCGLDDRSLVETQTAYVATANAEYISTVQAYTPIPVLPTPSPAPVSSGNNDVDRYAAGLAAELTKLAKPSVARIKTNRGGGTGWIYDVRGETAYILTNQHVTGHNPDFIEVSFDDGKPSEQGRLIARNSGYDLAIVSICCYSNYRSLQIADRRMWWSVPIS